MNGEASGVRESGQLGQGRHLAHRQAEGLRQPRQVGRQLLGGRLCSVGASQDTREQRDLDARALRPVDVAQAEGRALPFPEVGDELRLAFEQFRQPLGITAADQRLIGQEIGQVRQAQAHDDPLHLERGAAGAGGQPVGGPQRTFRRTRGPGRRRNCSAIIIRSAAAGIQYSAACGISRCSIPTASSASRTVCSTDFSNATVSSMSNSLGGTRSAARMSFSVSHL